MPGLFHVWPYVVLNDLDLVCMFALWVHVQRTPPILDSHLIQSDCQLDSVPVAAAQQAVRQGALIVAESDRLRVRMPS